MRNSSGDRVSAIFARGLATMNHETYPACPKCYRNSALLGEQDFPMIPLSREVGSGQVLTFDRWQCVNCGYVVRSSP